ncbi:MAG: hypothetical protein KAS32_31240 [Candidatus Peribacteraceae bacterium]|nr:hypothetical protein [Candidatus Peribacteraceae bacterium]
MLTEIQVKCNGVNFSLDDAVRYSMPIDTSIMRLVERTSQVSSEYDELDLKFCNLETELEEAETKFDNEQERADILTDKLEESEKELNNTTQRQDYLQDLLDEKDDEIKELKIIKEQFETLTTLSIL